MNFFGKVELRQHRTGTNAQGVQWYAFPFILRDPNNEEASISLEIFGRDTAQRFADQGFANGAIGTMHIFPMTKMGKDGREFNVLRCTRWEPANSSIVQGMPSKTEVMAQQASKDFAKPAPAQEVDKLPF